MKSKSIALLLMLACWATAVRSSEVDVDTMKADVLVNADSFSITLYDLYMYLQPKDDGGSGNLQWGSENRIREGLQQLYALNTLRLDALDARVMSQDEQAWVADYELTMKLVTKHLEMQVEAEAASIEWEELALEYYLANQAEFVTPETLTLQTLLIRSDACEREVALARAQRIVSEIAAGLDFEEAVSMYTEDDAARENKGVMAMVVRGQTVPEFEEAAFALESAGDLSAPVETEFGWHLIKLISRKPSEQRSFDAVKDGLIRSLETTERNKILDTLRWEAREKRPSGLIVNDTRLQQLLAELTEP